MPRHPSAPGSRWATRAVAASLFAVAAALPGCGSGERTYAVRGMVHFEDRSPLPKGQVVFQSDSLSAYGDIQQDGSFQMGTYGKNDGVPAGTYTVFLAGDLFASLPDHGEAADGSPSHRLPVRDQDQLLVDPSYCGPESGIEFEVEPHHRNKFEIVVKRPQAKG